MATQTVKKIYSDIDFTFTKKPVTADVALSYDSQAVIRSVRNLLLTNHFERPFNPQIGSGLDALLFEPVSSITSSLLENEIRTTIENFEPRATLNEVTVTPEPDKNAYSVYLSFYIENSTLPTTVTLLLERNR